VMISDQVRDGSARNWARMAVRGDVTGIGPV
jgi:hypothetical protein